MKLHVLSDLHTEFHDFSPPATDADVVVLAGDIGVGIEGIAWAAREFPDRPVVYVPGNHEYYGHDIGSDEELKAAAPAGINVLNNDALVINGVRVLGCTLWTDFEYYGAGAARVSRDQAKRLIADFTSIRRGKRPFTPEDSVDLHRKSVAWLVTELSRAFDGPAVVVTHHLPAAPSIARQYENDTLNPAFASNLAGIMEEFRPDLWIHGHTHVACDYELFGTRVVCNPRGYPGESVARGFLSGLVVEV